MRKLLYRARIPFALIFLGAICLAAALYWRQARRFAARDDLIALHDAALEGYSRRSAVGGLLPEGTAPYIDPLSLVNPDYLGWLTVYGTEVDYPVVLGEDNEWYLTHDFYGERSSAGCLFADSAADREADGNLIIYGHHMKDGTMFGSLNRFKSADFLREHGLLRWEIGGVGRYYEIFAVLVIPGYAAAGDYFPIQEYLNEIDGEKTEELLAALRQRARLWRDIELDGTDRFLFLVTCDYTRSNGRLLLCGKRLDNEVGSGGLDS